MVPIAETTNQGSSDPAGFVVQQQEEILRVGGTLDMSSDHGTVRAKPASTRYSTSAWTSSIDSGLAQFLMKTGCLPPVWADTSGGENM
jgi:hypothetical protein